MDRKPVVGELVTVPDGVQFQFDNTYRYQNAVGIVQWISPNGGRIGCHWFNPDWTRLPNEIVPTSRVVEFK